MNDAGFKINIDEIEFVSLHFSNGESISYRTKEFKRISLDLALDLTFCFAVINVANISRHLIIKDIEKLIKLLDV
ncbi:MULTISPECIES: hypothetical protein [unclassified Saccharicrinis]|uniref:hypothetical protein n=1 Tax=unclassified Saccharicrinis TaxID=2646859 RepID=UPI003D3328FF